MVLTTKVFSTLQRNVFIPKSPFIHSRATKTASSFTSSLHNHPPLVSVMTSCAVCSSRSIVATHFSPHPCRSISTSTVKTENTYEDAIKKLNTLQSNLKTLQHWSRNPHVSAEEVLAETVRNLERGGLTRDQLDTLNVIHVSGTKGKGTTCAFVESILRHAGLRTGFYSSPHLVAVRERIRIDGKPLSKDKFAKYFFHVYRNMESSKESEDDMPAYFRFLTCMGFYAFFQEKLDVVVLEVGMGGTMDSTNIVRRPIVTGITSLALEHQHVLGNTLEEIALAKAGIMKTGVPCFTVPTHPNYILQVLHDHAVKAKCPLLIAPPLTSYERLPVFKDDSAVTRLNASLAIQLANTFIQQKYPERLSGSISKAVIGQPFPLLSWHRSGLANCFWPGRFQILQRSSQLTYFLDGAHTAESLMAAHEWFFRQTADDKSTLRVLLFNVTGDRNAEEMLRPLAISNHYDSAVFCPIVTLEAGAADNWSAVRDETDVMEKAIKLGSIWKRLCPTERTLELPHSINEAMEYLDEMSKDTNVNVLVTGSLHLVGAFLSLLDPELTNQSLTFKD